MLTDEELLARVRDEQQRSIGFGAGDGGTLTTDRERALLYAQGDVSKDIPTQANRSSAVSTDVAEAVETALPDLMEVLVAGDDVATFKPVGPEDEAAAKQETDFVNWSIYDDNRGFLAVYSGVKDALLLKTGLIKAWWEGGEEQIDETYSGKTQEEAVVASLDGEIIDFRPCECGDAQAEPLFDFTLRRTKDNGRVRVCAVAPEDFTVAADTVILSETTYCAMRSRPRAQDVIADGIAREIVDALPAYGSIEDAVALARDEADENIGHTGAGGLGDLRTVEIVEHYLRIDADGDGKPELWRIVTGGDGAVFIEKEKVNQIPFAALTPYLNPHRFYGESVADKLIQIQQIKTTLARMLLDSGYFALNQRVEVAEDQVGDFTMSDLLRNQPGFPIRSKTGTAVRPIVAGNLGFDVFGALEQFSVMGEQRTGIVRNAQGLKPDTLHDTAQGATILISAAAKRLRLIARVFAETGMRDLYLIVHALLRENCTRPVQARLQGGWAEVTPSSWGVRKDMTIEVGLGSSGREQEMQALGLIIGKQEALIERQGGFEGPFVTADLYHNSLSRLVQLTGQKAPEMYFADPAKMQGQAKPPQPPPGVVEAQMKAKLAEQEMRAKLDLQRQEMEGRLQLQRDEMQQKFALERFQIEQEMQLKRDTAASEAQLKATQAAATIVGGPQDPEPTASLPDVHFGGDPG